MFNRLCKPLQSNSFFLFGARGTGKSTLLGQLFKPDATLWIDLLDIEIEEQLQQRPMGLVDRLRKIEKNKKITWVVIDEIQKAPKLLDVVHSEIERGRFRFALTGSSARKLKRGAANLLAGRAFLNTLYPLTHVELGDDFDLESILQWGSLPKIFSLQDIERKDYLTTYAHTYLREEIQAEQLIRKVPPFRAFLTVAAQSAGQIINYSNIARDVSSDPVSIQSYFEILEDTLVGFQLNPFHRSIRKRQRQNPKFYFFDLGVQHAVAKTLAQKPVPGTYEYGRLFEQWVILEIVRLSRYYKKDWEFSYLRTKDDAEVDLIIERPGAPDALVEIKSTRRIQEKDVSSLNRFVRDFPKAEGFCLSVDPVSKQIGRVNCLPWNEGFKELGV